MVCSFARWGVVCELSPPEFLSSSLTVSGRQAHYDFGWWLHIATRNCSTGTRFHSESESLSEFVTALIILGCAQTQDPF